MPLIPSLSKAGITKAFKFYSGESSEGDASWVKSVEAEGPEVTITIKANKNDLNFWMIQNFQTVQKLKSVEDMKQWFVDQP